LQILILILTIVNVEIVVVSIPMDVIVELVPLVSTISVACAIIA
jgi:hypothetical protein